MVLRTIAIISLALAGICSLIISIDLLTGHKQKMWIMNIVWPVTALYAGPVALLAYYTIGRRSLAEKKTPMHSDGGQKKPFWQSVVVGTLHCGSGCTLGDLTAEFGLLLFPFSLFGSWLLTSWVVDYVLAFLIGILFQYYAIKPMKNLSTGKAVAAALKADSLSLTCWQVGMYGWMAISIFVIFHQRLHADTFLFWFMMQIGMLLGFLTAWPVNWWLIKKGIKEKM